MFKQFWKSANKTWGKAKQFTDSNLWHHWLTPDYQLWPWAVKSFG